MKHVTNRQSHILATEAAELVQKLIKDSDGVPFLAIVAALHATAALVDHTAPQGYDAELFKNEVLAIAAGALEQLNLNVAEQDKTLEVKRDINGRRIP